MSDETTFAKACAQRTEDCTFDEFTPYGVEPFWGRWDSQVETVWEFMSAVGRVAEDFYLDSDFDSDGCRNGWEITCFLSDLDIEGLPAMVTFHIARWIEEDLDCLPEAADPQAGATGLEVAEAIWDVLCRRSDEVVAIREAITGVQESAR